MGVGLEGQLRVAVTGEFLGHLDAAAAFDDGSDVRVPEAVEVVGLALSHSGGFQVLSYSRGYLDAFQEEYGLSRRLPREPRTEQLRQFRADRLNGQLLVFRVTAWTRDGGRVCFHVETLRRQRSQFLDPEPGPHRRGVEHRAVGTVDS